MANTFTGTHDTKLSVQALRVCKTHKAEKADKGHKTTGTWNKSLKPD